MDEQLKADVEAGQRRTPRRPLVLQVTGTKIFGTTENLSKGGMFLQTDEPLAIGETITATLSFPGLLEPVHVSGMVVRRRSKAPGLPAGIGVAFTQNSIEAVPALAGLLDYSSAPASDPDLAAEALQLPPYRVLVIEDDPQIAKVYERVLVKVKDSFAQHLVVELAPGGREALQLLCETPYDLLVTDLMMPFMDGFTVIERVRAHPRIAHVKIMAISGGASEDLLRAQVLGADAVVAKPMGLFEVVDTVRELLRIRPTG
jgi:uncharacterized protein (TIGR02266 family)